MEDSLILTRAWTRPARRMQPLAVNSDASSAPTPWCARLIGTASAGELNPIKLVHGLNCTQPAISRSRTEARRCVRIIGPLIAKLPSNDFLNGRYEATR
ncbi:hypothetical protein [Actinospica robiniae]|uniref:hypothetical protein n=1 Tax=Actinospica robiniae TaxID=304901 RepID=UPI00054D3FE6|nr:hypothetical protein [Actinospica robiniae]